MTRRRSCHTPCVHGVVPEANISSDSALGVAMSPANIATYFLDNATIGRRFKTHRDIWESDDKDRIVGLLELLLLTLEGVDQRSAWCERRWTADQWERHGLWLEYWQAMVQDIVAKLEANITRVRAMFPEGSDLGEDVSGPLVTEPFHDAFLKDCKCEFMGLLHGYQSRLERLEQVKSPQMVKALFGIGKSKRAKLLKSISPVVEIPDL